MLTVSLAVIAFIAGIQLTNAGDCNYGLWKPYFDQTDNGDDVMEGGLAFAAGICQTRVTEGSTIAFGESFMVQCDYSGMFAAANVLLYDDVDCSSTPRATIPLAEDEFVCCEACEDLFCDISVLTVDSYPSPDCTLGVGEDMTTSTYSIYSAPSQMCYEVIVDLLNPPNDPLEIITSRMFQFEDSALIQERYSMPDCNGTVTETLTFELNQCTYLDAISVSVNTTLEILLEDDSPDIMMASDLTGSEYGTCNWGKYKPMFDGGSGEGSSGRGMAFVENICQSKVSESDTIYLGESFVVRCDYSGMFSTANVYVYGSPGCAGFLNAVIPLEWDQYSCCRDCIDTICGYDQLVVNSYPNEDCSETVEITETYTYGIRTDLSQSCYETIVPLERVGEDPLELVLSRQLTFGDTAITQDRYSTSDCLGDPTETLSWGINADQCTYLDALSESFKVTLTPFVLGDDGDTTLTDDIDGDGTDDNYAYCNYGQYSPFFDEVNVENSPADIGGLAYVADVCQSVNTYSPLWLQSFMIKCDYSGSTPSASVYWYNDVSCIGEGTMTETLADGLFNCCEYCLVMCPTTKLSLGVSPGDTDCGTNRWSYSYTIFEGFSQQCYGALYEVPPRIIELTSRQFTFGDDGTLTQDLYFENADCSGTPTESLTILNQDQCTYVEFVDTTYGPLLLDTDQTDDVVMATDLTGVESGTCNYGLYKPLFDGGDGDGATGRGLAYVEGICQTAVTGGSSFPFGSSFMVQCDYSGDVAAANVLVYEGSTDCSSEVFATIPLDEGQFECCQTCLVICGHDQLVVQAWPNNNCGATSVGNSQTFTYGIRTAPSQMCYDVDIDPSPIEPLELELSRQFSFGETSMSQMRYTMPECANLDTTLVWNLGECTYLDLLDRSYRVTMTPSNYEETETMETTEAGDGETETMMTTMEGDGETDDVEFYSVNMLVVFGLFFVNYFL